MTVSLAASVANDVNNTQNSASNAVSVQYVQPVTAAPVVTAPANGSLLNTTTPTYSGTAVAGSTVTVYVDGSAIGTTTATGGSFTLAQPTALSQGSHTVYATAQTSGSAVSANSATNTFTVDTVQPTVAITSSTAANGGSTSTSPIAYTVTFSENVNGSFVQGDVTVSNGTISGFTTLVAGTTFAFNVTPTANGAVTVNVPANVAQDGAGNFNTAAPTYTITYTQLVTAAPVVNTPAHVSLINTATPTYTGTAPAGSTVTVYVDGSAIGTTTATGGSFSLAQPTALSQGTHTVNATAQTSGSAVSPTSNTNGFTVDTVQPTVAITSSTAANGGTSGTSPFAYTVTFSEAVTGFVAGDVTVGNGSISGFTAVNSTTYTFNVTPAANGAVTVNVPANVAQDAAGNFNTAASQYSITYSQPVTAAPVVTAPANGSLLNTTTPTYSGTAVAGSTVTVYVDGTAIGTTTATGGSFTLAQPTALSQGSHTVYATAQTSGSAVSANSATNTFTVDTVQPTVTITSSTAANGGSTSTSPIAYTVTFSENVNRLRGRRRNREQRQDFGLHRRVGHRLHIQRHAHGQRRGNGERAGQRGPGRGWQRQHRRAHPLYHHLHRPGDGHELDRCGIERLVYGRQLDQRRTHGHRGRHHSGFGPEHARHRGRHGHDQGPDPEPGRDAHANRRHARTSRANLTNNGTFQPTGGTVSLGSTALASLLGSGNTRFWNLTIGSQRGAVGHLGQHLGAAPVHAQRQLRHQRQCASPWRSNATNTALVVNNGSSAIVGTATVQRYIAPDLNPNLGYRHVSAPISNATVASLATGSFTPVVNPAYNTSATPATTTLFPTVYGYDQSHLATTTNNLADFDKGWFSPNAR